MGREWVIFVTSIDDMIEGREGVFTIRDLTPGQKKYNAKVVRAKVSGKPGTLAGADVLWVRSWNGNLYSEPWAIKIIEEAGDYVAGIPHGETLSLMNS